MTVSADDRLEDCRRVLRLVTQKIGDARIDSQDFYPNQQPFDDVLETTWTELLDQDLIIGRRGRHFQLTGAGWIRGIELTGELHSSKTKERVRGLTKYFKRRIKGRSTFDVVTVQDVASGTGFPAGWVYNAVDGDLIGKMYCRISVSWEAQDQMRNYIRIPHNFCMDVLMEEI